MGMMRICCGEASGNCLESEDRMNVTLVPHNWKQFGNHLKQIRIVSTFRSTPFPHFFNDPNYCRPHCLIQSYVLRERERTVTGCLRLDYSCATKRNWVHQIYFATLFIALIVKYSLFIIEQVEHVKLNFFCIILAIFALFLTETRPAVPFSFCHSVSFCF